MMFQHFWYQGLFWTIFLILRKISFLTLYMFPPEVYIIPSQHLKTIFTKASQFVFLNFYELIWDLGGKFRQKQIHFLSFLKLTIHNQNVVELAHCIILIYTQELGTCFGDTGILVWQLFSLVLLKSASSWETSCCTVLFSLME